MIETEFASVPQSAEPRPQNDSSPCLSVVMPAYDEEKTLRAVIEQVLRLPMVLELIAVDDHSQDATPRILAELGRVYPSLSSIRHDRNRGKTAAVKTGIAASRGAIVIILDADLEYDPAEIPEVIGPILHDKADVVYGSRFLVRKATRVLYFYHYIANRLLTFWCNLFTNMNMTDVETGYKAFRLEVLRSLELRENGFGLEPEITAKVCKQRLRIYELPISYYGRTRDEGKKITWKDGFRAIWVLVRVRTLG